jgi:hypothetical protein
MEKELDGLIERLEGYLSGLEKELELNSNDEFLKGKVDGVRQALVMIRIYNIDETGRQRVDVIIDTPIMQNTSKEYDDLLEKIMEMDPVIKKANEKLLKISADTEFVKQVKLNQLSKLNDAGYEDKVDNMLNEHSDGQKEMVSSEIEAKKRTE